MLLLVRKRKKRLVLFLLACALVVATFLSLVGGFNRDREPSYQGHRLSWWLDRYGKGYPGERDPKAAGAISQIGTNGLPFLFARIRCGPQPTPSRVRAFAKFLKGHLPSAITPQLLDDWADENSAAAKANTAASALRLLGTNANSLIPELQKLAADPNNGYGCIAAEDALLNLGSDGFAALLHVIATPNLPHRGALLQGSGFASHLKPVNEMALAGQGDTNFKINSLHAAPVLLQCLQDDDKFLREKAERVLAVADPDSTVPALTNFLLKPPSPPARRLATDALAAHGPQARVAVPLLLSRLHDPVPEIRSEATNALREIAPDALTNISAPSSIPPF